MKKAHLSLIEARYEAVNAHDLDRFQDFYADTVVWRDPGTARCMCASRETGSR